MANAGLDVSNVIWRISREGWRGCRYGKSCRGTIDILLADKADVNVSNKDHRIDATKFSLTVIYDANGKATFETSETQTKALLELKNEKNPNKNKYWVLKILRAYVWVVRPPILVNESLLTNTERAPGNRVAKYRARPQAARRYAA